MSANCYHFKEVWFLPSASASQVWEVLADPLLAPVWWRGVYVSVEADGEEFNCIARGFLPYKLRFKAKLAAFLEPDPLVVVETLGDFQGRWEARLVESEAGTSIRIDWRVRVEHPLVKNLSFALKPLFAWNHKYTKPLGEIGLRQYLQNLND